MNTESNTRRGVTHGKMIELVQAPGRPDGQEVIVVVRLLLQREARAPREALRRPFGGWAENAAELEDYLEWNRQQRSMSRASSQMHDVISWNTQ